MKVSGAAAGGGFGETLTHVHRIGVAETPAQAALVSSELTCIPSATEQDLGQKHLFDDHPMPDEARRRAKSTDSA
jgi:hypothetical protein